MMIKLECRHCKRYMGEAEMIVGELICPLSTCRGTTQFKSIKADFDSALRFKFANPEKQPKTKAAEVS